MIRLFGGSNKKPRTPESQVHQGNGPYFPMQSYNGLSVPDSRGALSQTSQVIDKRPAQFRRYVNMGYMDVQLNNGLRNGIGSGSIKVLPAFIPTGQAYVPHIPGQTRGDAGGFHKRPGSSYNYQDILNNGPGSQPEHPGGPGTIAGSTLYNPMTG